MFHEARHAWLIYFIEHPMEETAARVIEALPALNLQDPINGPYWGLLSEADAFNMQGVFLRDHGAPTTIPNLGDVYAVSNYYLNKLKQVTNKSYIVPLPYSKPY